MNIFNNAFCSIRMGVANKNLTEIVVFNQANNMRYAIFVQFVKNIIQ